MSEQNNPWSFFSNYTHVLVCIAEDPEIRLKDIAVRVPVTERTAQRIITHLKEANIVITAKNGRRNQYLIDLDQQLRHPIEAHATVGELLKAIVSSAQVKKIRKQFNAVQKTGASL